MAKYVVLLRGINVGGNNKIEMAKLKSCFESLGYTNVITYINSGNVIFDSRETDTEKMTDKVELLISKVFKLKIPVIVRRHNNIKKICKKIPTNWVNDKEYKTDVMFLWEDFANRDTLKQIATNPKVDTLLYIDDAIVWHLKKKNYSKSKMNDIIGTDIYKNMTVRNVNTVRKLNILMNG